LELYTCSQFLLRYATRLSAIEKTVGAVMAITDVGKMSPALAILLSLV
jgi:hypothetical protein